MSFRLILTVTLILVIEWSFSSTALAQTAVSPAVGTSSSASTSPPLLDGPRWIGEIDQAGAFFAERLAHAGDVNDDGFEDVVIGSRLYTNTHAGEGGAFLFLGSETGPSLSPDWTREGGQIGAALAFGISGAGDVNQDGYADVLLGAYGYEVSSGNVGAAFLFLGGPGGLSQDPDWTGDAGSSGNYGEAVASAGDVNADGYDDIIVGARGWESGPDPSGGAFVYHGGPSGPSPQPDWVGTSDQSYSQFGNWVAGAGDVDGDGFDDVLVCAERYDNGEQDEGRVFLYLGSNSGLANSPVWSAEGNQEGAQFGHSASIVSDVNGDGFDDVLVGAPNYDRGASSEGAVFLFLGGPSGPSTSADWMVTGGAFGTILGGSVDGVGDLNQDGLDDVVLGAEQYDSLQGDEGRALVYLGSPTGLSPTPAWIGGPNQPSAQFGVSVAGVGDVDGNGFVDLIVGAYKYSSGEVDEGAAFLYSGGLADSGTPFCFGDGSGAPCGCSNEDSILGEGGCLNSHAVGARLRAFGTADTSRDNLVLVASHVPNRVGLFFQGMDLSESGQGVPFGDGLRCCSQLLVRLEIVDPPGTNGPTSVSSSIAISNHHLQQGLRGSTRCYQYWYRDPVSGPCGAGFNLSNAVLLTWQ